MQADLEFEPPVDTRRHISLARADLIRYPRSSLTWVDLALAYASLGNLKKAERCINAALTLDPENRFVLRSAVRFFLHAGEKERASYILRRAKSTAQDPWVVAAELAVSALIDKPSDYIKDARNMLGSGRYSERDTSELASQLATLNYRDGRIREARRLFSLAMVDPTENSFAQVQWMADKDRAFALQPGRTEIPRAFEVAAFKAYHAGNWHGALDQCWSWFRDEPFSTRPAVLGSYIAGTLLQNYDENQRFAQAGLTANPNDHQLLNNLAFALAQKSETIEAGKQLRAAKASELDERNLVPKLATAGLILFREGQIDAGRKMYQHAIEMAERATQEKLRQMASMYLAFEEIRAHTAEAVNVGMRALEGAITASEPDLVFVRDRLQAAVSRLIDDPAPKISLK
jgi:tetratricopeptide (TPR) repeat protein